MKLLLTVTAVIEVGAGLALMLIPTSAFNHLLGPSLDSPLAWTITHLTGLALLALGVACWLARSDSNSRAAKGLVSGMLLYNAGVAALIAYAILALALPGMFLWPAVMLHTLMSLWCVKSILNKAAQN